MASAKVLPWVGSDHTPVIWDSGTSQIPKKKSFKFEKWWLAIPEFKNLVDKAWATRCNSNNPVDRWQKRVRCLRKLANGWSANLDSFLRKHKKNLMEEYDKIDIKSEISGLSAD